LFRSTDGNKWLLPAAHTITQLAGSLGTLTAAPSDYWNATELTFLSFLIPFLSDLLTVLQKTSPSLMAFGK
jgi:hypothetical protein